MALPIKGTWARRQMQPYVYSTWGTGINPVHSYYGSAPLRQTPLHGEVYSVTPPSDAVPEQFLPFADWGYTPEDMPVGYFQYDQRPSWDVPPEESVWRDSTDGMPPVDASGGLKNKFRSIVRGAVNYNWQEAHSLPSETVSEGWINKPKGSPADSEPSDPGQYEIQTAMAQRYRTRTNQLAQLRTTDEPRSEISSRVVGQRLKEYSGGERHYDMLPKEQDDIPRPFYYRTAGTGNYEDMAANAMYASEPMQRTPPPDPAVGLADVTQSGDYGYTPEDQFYA